VVHGEPMSTNADADAVFLEAIATPEGRADPWSRYATLHESVALAVNVVSSRPSSVAELVRRLIRRWLDVGASSVPRGRTHELEARPPPTRPEAMSGHVGVAYS
jgi:hypothetical protein